MRAVSLEGGHGNRVEKQMAEHCDSGIVVEAGATDAAIVHSWFHDCRVGVLVWGAGSVDVHDVAITAPRDHAVVVDAPLDLKSCTLDGDVWAR
jgi:nitrous oxidase accessory protein NosD